MHGSLSSSTARTTQTNLVSKDQKKKKKYKINVYMTFNIKTVDGIFIHSLEITTKIYISQKHRSK